MGRYKRGALGCPARGCINRAHGDAPAGQHLGANGVVRPQFGLPFWVRMSPCLLSGLLHALQRKLPCKRHSEAAVPQGKVPPWWHPIGTTAPQQPARRQTQEASHSEGTHPSSTALCRNPQPAPTSPFLHPGACTTHPRMGSRAGGRAALCSRGGARGARSICI